MKFKNRTARFVICAVLALACACSLFTSCNKIHTIKADGKGGYVDKRTGVTYYDAPACFEYYGSAEEYATFAGSTLAGIMDLDPKKWLCDTTYGGVYYSSDITLPSFEEMTVTEIKLCYEDVYSFEFASITDPDEIAKVKDAYLNGERGIGFATAPDKVVAVKLLFEECPYIYYCLTYSCNASGEAYLTNRSEGRTVVADGLFDEYISITQS